MPSIIAILPENEAEALAVQHLAGTCHSTLRGFGVMHPQVCCTLAVIGIPIYWLVLEKRDYGYGLSACPFFFLFCLVYNMPGCTHDCGFRNL